LLESDLPEMLMWLY